MKTETHKIQYIQAMQCKHSKYHQKSTNDEKNYKISEPTYQIYG
jgi:hypothetical protein